MFTEMSQLTSNVHSWIKKVKKKAENKPRSLRLSTVTKGLFKEESRVGFIDGANASLVVETVLGRTCMSLNKKLILVQSSYFM